jgi:hypothetical protein
MAQTIVRSGAIKAVGIESTPNISEFLSRFFGIGSILNLRAEKFKCAIARRGRLH